MLVAVCAKCDGDTKAVRAALKSSCKRAGKRVRVVKVSCLDICPKRAVAVAVARDGTAPGTAYFVVRDEADSASVATVACA